MGLDVTAYRGIRPLEDVHWQDADEELGTLDAFGNGTLSSGWEGWPTEVAYAYEAKMERSLGSWNGVSSFYRLLATWIGEPGASNDPGYDGPLSSMFHSMEWMGPVDCRLIAEQLRALEGAWLDPLKIQALTGEGFDVAKLAEYYKRWQSIFTFVKQDGLVHFH